MSGARGRVAYRVGDVGQVGAKAEIDGGEDGEDGDNQLWRQHALPGLHALLAESRVRGLVLGGVRLGLRFLFGGIGAATTTGCHGGRCWVVVGARVRCLDVNKGVAVVEEKEAKTKMGSHWSHLCFVDADRPAILMDVWPGPCSGCGRLQFNQLT